MRTAILLIFLFGMSTTIAQSLIPSKISTATSHLVEVNPLWKDYLSSEDQKVFENENQRISYHLQQVIQYLSLQECKQLSPIQKQKRNSAIDQLKGYRKRALFPINDQLVERKPIFKDAYASSCAVAYLMEQTGEQALVNKIQRENNYTYLKDLAMSYGAINDWAQNNGFSLDELALIQPGYPPVHRTFSAWGGGGPVEGSVNVMVSNSNESLLYVAGNFTEIDGRSAASIIAWDGEEWIDMGNGVTGEIIDLVTYNEKVIIAGEFVLNDDTSSTNIAYYDDGVWHGLQKGSMEGSIRTLAIDGINVYIGGDFQKVNGDYLPHLASLRIVSSDPSWSNSIPDYSTGVRIDVQHAITVNGPVNDIAVSELGIVVGGQFTQTSPEVDTTFLKPKEVRNLALWNRTTGSWVNIDGPFDLVDKVEYNNNVLYVTDAGEEFGEPVTFVHKLILNQWVTSGFGLLDTNIDPPGILGFMTSGNRTFIYGNVAVPEFSFVVTAGFMMLGDGGTNSDKGILFDNIVTAAIPFQEHIYFAGDFVHPSGPYEGLVKATRLGLDDTHELGEDFSVSINLNSGQLTVRHVGNEDKLIFSLFEINGQLINSFPLSKDGTTVKTAELISGSYIYQVTDGKNMSSGLTVLTDK